MKINITKRVVRVNPDGTRTVISETTSQDPDDAAQALAAAGLDPGMATPRTKKPARRWFLWAFAALGALQVVYGAWGAFSDSRSTALILKDASCQLSVFNAQFPIADGACRLESAVVVGKTYYTQRHGSPIYWLQTVTPAGKRSDTPLATKDDQAFYNRMSATERIQQLRFVPRGYHRTNDILAFSDHHGTVLSRYDPRSGTHYNGMFVFIGGSIVLVSLLILYRNKRPGSSR